MDYFLQQLINGVQLGTVYALIALGYTMVYGIVKLINFAHADIFMIGVYTAFFTAKWYSTPFLLVIIISMVVCAIIGVLMEKLAYKPLRHKPRLSALITALGVSLFLENFCALPFVFGPEYRYFPEIIKVKSYVWQKYDVVVTNIFLLNLVVVAILLGGLFYLVHYTMIGKKMRAVSYDKATASLMGINIDRTISFTFFVGAALAGASGVLYGLTYRSIQSPYLGIWPGWKAFIAAVIGGIGNIPGAVVGSYLMGISEVYANSINSNLGFGIAFAILIIVLIVRPSGILGKKEQEKI
ncbi:TPA: branched-chain amino acid ABC transporter permease [Candidatus Poribacteria bacterium]|nr:branched-chain amino acid ABC transporter permease [Candidatus Poribacteria bacterium]